MFGARAIMAGPTSILCLSSQTLESIRMKRQEVDQAISTDIGNLGHRNFPGCDFNGRGVLLKSILMIEEYIEKQGVPQIDFVLINENSDLYYQLNFAPGTLSAQKQKHYATLELKKKFKRAIKRLVKLARAA